MATVDLDVVWVNPLDDLSAGLQLDAVTGLSGDDGTDGQVQVYAGGRKRLVSGIGRAGTRRLQLGLVDQATVDALVALAGRTVLLRDPRGRRVWGAWFAVPWTDRIITGDMDVSLDFTEVTVDEEV